MYHGYFDSFLNKFLLRKAKHSPQNYLISMLAEGGDRHHKLFPNSLWAHQQSLAN